MKNISAISFSYAENSLQYRGLSLVDHFLNFKKVYSMKDFLIPLCYSNSPDGEVPEGVKKFDQVLAESDALVFSIAEAGGHYCASFKNVMDWLIVKTRFNSQLGQGYALSNKPIYILTFTPTPAGSGDRHFSMTSYILKEKFGADVRHMFVFNQAWANVLPGNVDFVRAQSQAIARDLGQISEIPRDTSGTAEVKYDVEKWLRQYQAWDLQWRA